MRNLGKKPPAQLETLNFNVEREFKRKYKSYAASRNMDMLELLARELRRVSREVRPVTPIRTAT